MKKPLVLIIAGASVVVLGSLGVILFLPSGEPESAPVPSSAEAAPPQQPQPRDILMPPRVEPDVVSKGGTSARGQEAPPREFFVAPRPDPGTWEAVPVLPARASRSLAREFDGLRGLMSQCFDPETAARYGTQAPSVTGAGGAAQPGATTVLMIEVEVTEKGSTVVDAPVEVRGDVSEETLSCVQNALRGKPTTFRGTPGQRLRFRYVLQP